MTSDDTHLTAIFQDNLGKRRYWNLSFLDFIGATDDVSGGDSWSYNTRKAPVKSSSPTNQHPIGGAT